MLDYPFDLCLKFAWSDIKGLLGLKIKTITSRSAEKFWKLRIEEQSDCVGEVGGRFEFDVKIQSIKNQEGFYGLVTLHIATEEVGNQFVWFHSGETKLVVGDRVVVRGTIKRHGIYNGIPQTILTHVDLVSREVRYLVPNTSVDLEELALAIELRRLNLNVVTV